MVDIKDQYYLDQSGYDNLIAAIQTAFDELRSSGVDIKNMQTITGQKIFTSVVKANAGIDFEEFSILKETDNGIDGLHIHVGKCEFVITDTGIYPAQSIAENDLGSIEHPWRNIVSNNININKKILVEDADVDYPIEVKSDKICKINVEKLGGYSVTDLKSEIIENVQEIGGQNYNFVEITPEEINEKFKTY